MQILALYRTCTTAFPCSLLVKPLARFDSGEEPAGPQAEAGHGAEPTSHWGYKSSKVCVRVGLNPTASLKLVEVKKMYTSLSPDPHILLYVLGILKGGYTLGEVATQARQFENEMNAWYVELEQKEKEAEI